MGKKILEKSMTKWMKKNPVEIQPVYGTSEVEIHSVPRNDYHIEVLETNSLKNIQISLSGTWG